MISKFHPPVALVRDGHIFGIGVDGHLDPTSTRQALYEAVAQIKGSSGTKKIRVAMVDIPLSNAAVKVAAHLRDRLGCELAFYADHHFEILDGADDKTTKVNAAVERNRADLAALFQQVYITTRADRPTCVDLVQRNNWDRLYIDIVIFDADCDGFLSYVQGLGWNYPNMRQDAAILDGNKRGQLSPMGMTIATARQFLIRPYSLNASDHWATKERVFRAILEHLIGSNTSSGFLAAVHRARDEAQAATRVLVTQTTIDHTSGLAHCDMRAAFRAGPVDVSLWKQTILQHHGQVLLCSVGFSPEGDVVWVELPHAWRNQCDLRRILPPSVKAHVGGRAQIPLNRWDEFRRCWSEFYRQNLVKKP